LKIGIDVGGTFADGVCIRDGILVKRVKLPCETELLSTILSILDRLIADLNAQEAHITLSTTLITNLIAEANLDPVGIIAIPGPGCRLKDMSMPFPVNVTGGCVDLLGRVTTPVDLSAAVSAAESFREQHIHKIAVVGKFSNRNPIQELEIRNQLQTTFPDLDILTGHETWADLSYPKRCAATALTLAIRERVKTFFHDLNRAIHMKGIRSRTDILKADGGTMPIGDAVSHPLETMFSGPAASAMGSVALFGTNRSFAFADIGGSTTDIGLVLNGQPLLSRFGARIGEITLPVRAFAMASVNVGGDSPIIAIRNTPCLGRERLGPAVISGGSVPTLTDAARILQLHSTGSENAARTAMKDLVTRTGMSPETISDHVIREFKRRIKNGLDKLTDQWLAEPAYRIWELAGRETHPPKDLAVLGAGGALLAPILSDLVPGSLLQHEQGDVANAIGAALARPTFDITFQADSRRAEYTIVEDRIRETIDNPQLFKLPQAVETAQYWSGRKAEEMEIPNHLLQVDQVYAEQFNLIQSTGKVERIINVKLRQRSGILPEWKGYP
jgi:N-methylhydantoinase A/oxoprolinase/acetone carboxylase beta subunit